MRTRIASRNPIGVFDSGVGGLTVLRALRQRLPGESFLYLGDTARLPYGTKSAGTVQRYALNAARHLIEHGVRLLVVACNTASSYALPELAAASPVPVIGVVEPGVSAALGLGVRRLGVLGTEGTIRSGSYQAAIARLDGGTEVRAVACPLFVPLAEEGWGDHPVTDQVARHYLDPLLEWNVEALILGCTHYPLLKPSLARVAGPGVHLVDSASAVAETVAVTLDGASGSGTGEVYIHLTDASDHFLRVARMILDGPPEHLEVVTLPQS
ncbi:MAG TPA: glutamate racemase [Acidobacteria bacterium]|nr:glutamate racemase [Acidobacteriota bacterium]